MSVIADTYIYVIDDDMQVRKSIEFLFCSLGIEAIVFESGDHFVSQLENLRPGCVLMDLTLPGKCGLEVHKEMRARGRAWPLIFMTGSLELDAWQAAKKTDAVACLPKPFAHDDLLMAVHRAFVALRAARLSAASAGA